jgi:hypothetical protein
MQPSGQLARPERSHAFGRDETQNARGAPDRRNWVTMLRGSGGTPRSDSHGQIVPSLRGLIQAQQLTRGVLPKGKAELLALGEGWEASEAGNGQ